MSKQVYANLDTGELLIGAEDQPVKEVVRSAEAQAYHDQILAVLKGDDFGKHVTKAEWRLKSKEDQQKEELIPEWLIKFLEYFESLDGNNVLMFSRILEAILWVLAIGLLIFVVVRYRDDISNFVTRLNHKSSPHQLPTTMFGLDVQKKSIPKDVVARANELWQRGEHRQGIALLLRASLVKLLHDHACRFLDSDTETECCQRIEQQVTPNLSAYMRSLVSVWQQIAYAHRQPSDDAFDELCQGWQAAF